MEGPCFESFADFNRTKMAAKVQPIVDDWATRVEVQAEDGAIGGDYSEKKVIGKMKALGEWMGRHVQSRLDCNPRLFAADEEPLPRDGAKVRRRPPDEGRSSDHTQVGAPRVGALNRGFSKTACLEKGRFKRVDLCSVVIGVWYTLYVIETSKAGAGNSLTDEEMEEYKKERKAELQRLVQNWPFDFKFYANEDDLTTASVGFRDSNETGDGLQSRRSSRELRASYSDMGPEVERFPNGPIIFGPAPHRPFVRSPRIHHALYSQHSHR
jgi:hypothetical protein